MAGLLDAPGHYRRGGVAVTGAGEVHHIGPPADRVPHLMSDLLSWLGSTTEHPLIAGSVFHYEFEFIHPFEDGNGRMGRLWQTLMLTRWKPLFTNVPIENDLDEETWTRFCDRAKVPEAMDRIVALRNLHLLDEEDCMAHAGAWRLAPGP